jgi:hypothetical protein
VVSPGDIPSLAARGLIRGYRYTLSSVMGRQCRHMPSCSEYTEEAIERHGLWRGGWLGLARICRCNPWGTSGIDWVPERLPASATWVSPWRHGHWRKTHVPVCEAVDPDGTAPRSPKTPKPPA